MATINIALSSNKKKDGTYNIVFRLRACNKKKDIATVYYVQSHQYANGKIVKHPEKDNMNRNLTFQLNELLHKLQSYRSNADDIEQLYSFMTAKAIKDNFFDFAKGFIEEKCQDRTKNTYTLYMSTIARVREYNQSENLSFTQINYAFLQGFENYLKKRNNKINSISVHLRTIRTMYNRAIDYNVVELNYYPFRRYRIKSEKTAHRVLSDEQLINIFKLTPEAENKCLFADTFVLMFYLIGINIKDLFNAKYDFNTGRLNYRRAKTGRLYSIKVEPEAMLIMQKYLNKDGTLIYGSKYKLVRSFLYRMHEYLKDATGLDYITSYYARHTWATIASKIGISKDDIALALGHGGSTVTDVYINYDKERIDIANRRVIDYVQNYLKE